MNGPRVVMHRQPVSAIVDDAITDAALFVVCNDGAVFVATWNADGSKLLGWKEMPPVPGTERVALYKAEEAALYKAEEAEEFVSEEPGGDELPPDINAPNGA